MRPIAVILLFVALSPASDFAQSNTTAGLAGVGAGAALSSVAGQGGTTPSSASGGGAGSSTPIEIQVLVFQGMRQIAHNVAVLTAEHKSEECEAAVQHDPNSTTIQADRDKIAGYLASPKIDEAKLAAAKSSLDTHINSLSDEVKKSCGVLVEDPSSANQIALYQTVQGYYNHMSLLDFRLQDYFSLQVTPLSLVFTQFAGQSTTMSVQLKNTNARRDSVQIETDKITVGGKFVETASGKETSAKDLFLLDTSDCQRSLKLNESCTIQIKFPDPKMQAPLPGKLTAELDIPNDDTASMQKIQLTGDVKEAVKTDFSNLQEWKNYTQDLQIPEALENNSGLQALAGNLPPPTVQPITPAVGASTGTSTGTGSSPAASTPVGLTYLSDVGTALAGLKSNITYGASSFQPTMQAFELLVETELKMQGIFPYTSTSALDLTEANQALSQEFGQMLVWGNEVSTWTNLCKPPTANGTQGGNTQPAGGAPSGNTLNSSSNSACADSSVIVDLAVAQQMMTGYTTLLSTANDGSGNPVIADILRGWVLSSKMWNGISSLQLSVAAAGGSTKTNSIFGVNLFYTFAPSYNGGVIATFELRDKNNVLLESGARNVLFAYRKWPSKRFEPGEMKNAGTCDSFCSVEDK